MANSLSTITNNTYMYNINGDCQVVQIGTSNTLNESSNLTDVDEDELKSEIEDLRFRINRQSEDIDDMKTHLNDLTSKLERKDEEIAELKDRVTKNETNTNTNTRRFNRDTSNDITLKLRNAYRGQDTITISKKDSVNDLIKLMEEKNMEIDVIVIYRYRGCIETYMPIYSNNKKNDYSLEQLGVVDQDTLYYSDYIDMMY